MGYVFKTNRKILLSHHIIQANGPRKGNVNRILVIVRKKETHIRNPPLLNLLQSHHSGNPPDVDTHLLRDCLERIPLLHDLLVDDVPHRLRKHRLATEERVRRKRLVGKGPQVRSAPAARLKRAVRDIVEPRVHVEAALGDAVAP